MDITLLICTRNRAPLLRQCLEAVASLENPAVATWEILVVDNGSTDGTPGVINAFRKQHPEIRMRTLREDRRGVAHARKAGLAAATTQWVAFIDDDCFLQHDWLKQAAEFARMHPQAGVFGGKNELQWEHEPSDLCVAYGESLARQDLGPECIRLPQEGRQGLCGAGMVLRREAVAQSEYLSHGLLQGRDHASLTAGEDTEVLMMIRNAGWEIWYVPALVLRHWIPATRMKMRHLLPLHRGFGEAEAYLRLLSEREPLTSWNRWRGLGWALGNLCVVMRRFWLGFVRYRSERPTWIIRFWHSMGFVKGALRLLVLGRAR